MSIGTVELGYLSFCGAATALTGTKLIESREKTAKTPKT